MGLLVLRSLGSHGGTHKAVAVLSPSLRAPFGLWGGRVATKERRKPSERRWNVKVRRAYRGGIGGGCSFLSPPTPSLPLWDEQMEGGGEEMGTDGCSPAVLSSVLSCAAITLHSGLGCGLPPSPPPSMLWGAESETWGRGGERKLRVLLVLRCVFLRFGLLSLFVTLSSVFVVPPCYGGGGMGNPSGCTAPIPAL